MQDESETSCYTREQGSYQRLLGPKTTGALTKGAFSVKFIIFLKKPSSVTLEDRQPTHFSKNW